MTARMSQQRQRIAPFEVTPPCLPLIITSVRVRRSKPNDTPFRSNPHEWWSASFIPFALLSLALCGRGDEHALANAVLYDKGQAQVFLKTWACPFFRVFSVIFKRAIMKFVKPYSTPPRFSKPSTKGCGRFCWGSFLTPTYVLIEQMREQIQNIEWLI